jgi:ubiquitin-activating enzyme E1
MCTLRNFPNLIEHCIEWARAQFDEIYEGLPRDFNSFIQNKEEFFEALKKEGAGKVEKLKQVLSDEIILANSLLVIDANVFLGH